MKNKAIKIPTLLTALLMLVSVILTAAVIVGAAGTNSGTCGENLTWTLDDIGTLTVSGSGDMEDFINSGKVPWYPLRKEIKKAVIENGVTSIGAASFSGCVNCKSVSIPDSVISIGTDAFRDCGWLSTVSVPNGVKSIGAYAFYGCGLSSVTLPKGMISIGAYAFADCKLLKTVIIPPQVTEIGEYAFGYYHEWGEETYGTEIVYNDETGETEVLAWDAIKDVFYKTEGFKIFCYSGTKGEEYALSNEMDYEIVKNAIKGDVNGDGKVDTTDIILIKRHLLKISLLSGASLVCADADGSGDIDETDYIAAKRALLGIGEEPADPPAMIALNSSDIRKMALLDVGDRQKIKEFVRENATVFVGIPDSDLDTFVDLMITLDVPHVDGKLPDYIEYRPEADRLDVTFANPQDSDTMRYRFQYVLNKAEAAKYKSRIQGEPHVYSEKIVCIEPVAIPETVNGELHTIFCTLEISGEYAYCIYYDPAGNVAGNEIDDMLCISDAYPILGFDEAQIKKDYYDHQKSIRPLLTALPEEAAIKAKLGPYGKAYVMFISLDEEYTEALTSETVAGTEFVYSSGQKLTVYKDGEFFTLQGSFEKGILTGEEIIRLSEDYYAKYPVLKEYIGDIDI